MANGVIKKDLGYNYLLPKYFAFPHNFSSLNEEEIGTITINEPGCYLIYVFYPWDSGKPTGLRVTIDDIEMSSNESLISNTIQCAFMYFCGADVQWSNNMKIYGRNINASGRTSVRVLLYKLPV